METLFVVLSLNVRRRSGEEIWPLQRFLKVSMILADLSRMSKVYRELGVKNNVVTRVTWVSGNSGM